MAAQPTLRTDDQREAPPPVKVEIDIKIVERAEGFQGINAWVSAVLFAFYGTFWWSVLDASPWDWLNLVAMLAIVLGLVGFGLVTRPARFGGYPDATRHSL